LPQQQARVGAAQEQAWVHERYHTSGVVALDNLHENDNHFSKCGGRHHLSWRLVTLVERPATQMPGLSDSQPLTVPLLRLGFRPTSSSTLLQQHSFPACTPRQQRYTFRTTGFALHWGVARG
jgi:hypothetical protein